MIKTMTKDELELLNIVKNSDLKTPLKDIKNASDAWKAKLFSKWRKCPPDKDCDTCLLRTPNYCLKDYLIKFI